MPRSVLSDDELSQLFNSIIMDDGRSSIAVLLSHCHEFEPALPYLTYDEHSLKKIQFSDYEVTIYRFSCEGNTVTAADIQFMRRHARQAYLLNPNRKLVKRLLKILQEHYGKKHVKVKKSEAPIDGAQYHFQVGSPFFKWYASTPFEEWESEFAVYDEPYSSGQADPNDTDTRHDFVICRFQRQA